MKHLRVTFILLIILSFCFIQCDKKSTEPDNTPYGDLNLDGTPNTIADAVLYTNYFVYGEMVFIKDKELQLKATDINRDGLYPDLADLVCLIRIIVGDALPYPKQNPILVDVRIGSTIDIDQPMGAAYIIFEGNAAPELLAGNMELKYSYDADNNVTRALVYSFEVNQTFDGEFINCNGTVKSLTLATYEGARVKLNLSPKDFYVYQNYPNPFNPSTVISFDTSERRLVSVVIISSLGEEMLNITDTYNPGRVEIEWDGNDKNGNEAPVGVYYYHVSTRDYTVVKKMQKF